MSYPFCFLELNSDDPDKSKEFYQALFDWKIEDIPMQDGGTYTLIKTGKEPDGGIFKNPVPDKAPSHWLLYIEADDIEGMTQQAEKLGANIIKGVTDVPGAGTFSIIQDPTGAVFGLWKCIEKK